MEAPEAIGILLQVLHRIAAADEHVAHVELEPSDRRIETRDEDVERNLAVDRFLVIGLVVEREPDAGAPRDRADRSEGAVGLLGHPVTARIRFQADAIHPLRPIEGSARKHATGGSRSHCLNEVASFHGALIYLSLNDWASDIISA